MTTFSSIIFQVSYLLYKEETGTFLIVFPSLNVPIWNNSYNRSYTDCGGRWQHVHGRSVGLYHAGLAQAILHHQHVLQAQRSACLQLLVGDFHGRGRHPRECLQEDTQETFSVKETRPSNRMISLFLFIQSDFYYLHKRHNMQQGTGSCISDLKGLNTWNVYWTKADQSELLNDFFNMDFLWTISHATATVELMWWRHEQWGVGMCRWGRGLI